jgi:hypothetical protein
MPGASQEDEPSRDFPWRAPDLTTRLAFAVATVSGRIGRSQSSEPLA